MSRIYNQIYTRNISPDGWRLSILVPPQTKKISPHISNWSPRKDFGKNFHLIRFLEKNIPLNPNEFGLRNGRSRAVSPLEHLCSEPQLNYISTTFHFFIILVIIRFDFLYLWSLMTLFKSIAEIVATPQKQNKKKKL